MGKKINWTVVGAGVVVGLAALALTFLGNPANMGFCIACFERDIAGALGMHGAAKVQYLRPEIMGLVLGAFGMSLATKEFRAKTGSAPAVRFVLGALVMIGALVFLGCPLRMVLRMGGGDLTALVGLAGFVLGIFIGVAFLKKGFTLRRAYPAGKAEGSVLPVVMLVLLVLGLAAPALFKASTEGPGSKHAPALVALGIALVVGALAQRARLCMVGGIRDVILFRDGTLLYGFVAKHAPALVALGIALVVGALAQRARLCMVGGIRDVILFRDGTLLYGFVAIFLTVLVGNMALGSFHPGMNMQPVAHSAQLWNLLGMTIVGWGSVLLGGCPLRQLILAGEGNGDSAVTVFGMMAGAAIAHNFALAGNPDSLNEAGQLVVGGISGNGKIAVVAALAALLAISGAAIAHNFALAGNPDSLNEAGQLVVGGISGNGKIAVVAALAALLAISYINSRQEEM